MLDPFVLLTPLLLLPVIALLRFVGCASLVGIDDVTLPPRNPRNPEPTLTGISPDTAVDTSSGFPLTLTGTDFMPDSEVLWNGQQPGNGKRARSGSTSTTLTVDITPADLVGKGLVSVSVFNQPPGGGKSKKALEFKVLVIVDFDNPPPTTTPGLITATYKNLNFRPNPSGPGWRWDRPNSQVAFNHISFDGGAGVPGQRSFAFVNGPRVLDSIEAYAKNTGAPTPGTLTLQDGTGQRTPSQQIPGTDPPRSVATDWDTGKPSSTVTVSFSRGTDLGILRITYIGPR